MPLGFLLNLSRELQVFLMIPRGATEAGSIELREIRRSLPRS